MVRVHHEPTLVSISAIVSLPVMKYSLLLLLLIYSFSVNAQADSVMHKVDSTMGAWQERSQHWRDSIHKAVRFQQLKDSLTVETWSVAMAAKVKRNFTVDSIRYTKQLDSVRRLQLPTAALQSKLDSLQQYKNLHFKEIQEKKNSLHSKVDQRLNTWQTSLQAKLDSIGFREKLPTTNLPKDIPLPKIEASGLALPEVPSLAANDFASLELPAGLSSINNELPFTTPEGLSDVQAQLTGIEGLSPKGIENFLGNPEALAEDLVKNMDGVDALEALSNPLDQLPENNPEAIKEMVKQQAINHFSGKEKVLEEAIDKVGRFKNKYNSVESVKDLPKRAPNQLKGKPFVERLVPAMTLQVQHFRALLVDVNLSAGYRLTHKITAGLGWNQRWAYETSTTAFVPAARVYGVRSYGEYSVKKGFGFRLDLECMNTQVREGISPQSEVISRQWVWSMMAGVKQEYTITGPLRGNIQLMYNLFDPKDKSPYVERLNFRMGFELRLKKGKKGSS